MSNWFTSIIFRIVEPLLSLLEQLGLREPIKKRLTKVWVWALSALSLLAALLWGAWLWLWNVTPPWAIPFLVIGVVTLLLTAIMWILWVFLRLIEQWYATHSRLSLDQSKYREIGTGLLTLADEILSARAVWEDAYPTSLYPTPGSDWDQLQKQQQDNREKIARRFRERFLTRVVYALHNISLLGIPIPHHMHYEISRRLQLSALCNYLSLVGSLLHNGQLDDARKLHANDLWRIYD